MQKKKTEIQTQVSDRISNQMLSQNIQSKGYNQIMQQQQGAHKSPANPNPQYQDLEQQSQSDKQQISDQSSTQQRYKSFYLLIKIIANISLSSLYFGYVLAYLSAVDFDTIVERYGIEMKANVAEGLLVGCMPIGGGVGALASNLLINNYSRRHCLLIVNAMALGAGILLYWPSMQMLLMARVTQGLCAGFFSSLAPLIMKQLSPRQVSGTLTSLNQIFIAFGVFFAFAFSQLLQLMFSDPNGKQTWWIVFGFPLLIITVQSLMLRYKYRFQTPKYLYTKNRDVQGMELLCFIYRAEYVAEVEREILKDIGRVQIKDIARQETGLESQKGQVSMGNQLRQAKTPRSAVIVAIHLAALQQFCGINAVMAYGGQIVAEDMPQLKLSLPIFINFEQVLASLFASYLLSKIGRKTLFQYGCMGAALACSVTALGFWQKQEGDGLGLPLIILGLVLFMANFGLTLGPVVWVYLPQIVQPNVLPYATGTNWGTAAFIMLLFPVIKQSLPQKNPALLFIFFAFWCVISYFFNKKYLIETKGKTEKEISDEYAKKASIC